MCACDNESPWQCRCRRTSNGKCACSCHSNWRDPPDWKRKAEFWKEQTSYVGSVLGPERDEARAWACRLYRRVQELEAEARRLTDWGRSLGAQAWRAVDERHEDTDALVQALAHILAHNAPRRGWNLSKLPPELRARVEAAAKDEWDGFVGRRG